MSNPYALAADDLRGCITARARLYRNLVVTVVLAGTGTVIASIVSGSASFLFAALLLPAMVLAYAARDAAAVHAWRRQRLEDWVAGAIQLSLLRGMLEKVPMLPSSTVKGMLESLPAWPDTVPAAARRPLAALQDRLARLVREALWARASLGTLALASLVAATLAARSAPLTGLPVALALLLVHRHLAQRQLAAALDLASRGVLAHADAEQAITWLRATSLQGLPHRLAGHWQRRLEALRPATGRTGLEMPD